MTIQASAKQQTQHRTYICTVAFFVCALAFLLFLFAQSAHAQQKILSPATLLDNMEPLSLAPHTILQSDPNDAITPDSIRATNGSNLSGTVQDGEVLDLGKDGVSKWLTIKLYNKSPGQSWLLDVGKRSEGQVGTLQKIHVYDVGFETRMEGAGPEIYVREIPRNRQTGAFNISIPAYQEKILAIHIAPEANRSTFVPLKIYSQETYFSLLQNRMVSTMIFCFFFCGLSVYVLAVCLVRKKYNYLIFSAYFAYLALAWILFNLIFLDDNVKAFARTAFMFGFSMMSLYMAKILLDITHSKYTERYILYTLAVLSTLTFLTATFIDLDQSVLLSALVRGQPAFVLIVLALMAAARTGNVRFQSNPFFYAEMISLFGFFVTYASVEHYLPHNAYLYNMFWNCFIPQAIILILALNEKFASMPADDRNFVNYSNRNIDLRRMREAKENAENTRLLKVIERERETLAEFRSKEILRTEEMRQAKVAADEANRAKSAFLAVVSHEIRTPMTGIMGMVRLLLDSSLNRQHRDYVMTIQESSEAMLALLNDILDFEKIQQGKIDLENISFDLHRLIQGVVTLMSGHAAGKGISLSARVDDNLPKYVKGDPTRLRQILLNLMGNAIKFTNEGSVTVFVKNLNTADNVNSMTPTHEKHMIYFGVQDTGIGIPGEDQKTLYTPFSQANASINRNFGGTGLGLAISKGLIERMGSSINVNSKENEGTTFFFTLGMEQGLNIHQEQMKDVPVVIATQAVKPLNIVIVDDNEITAKVIIGFLNGSPHQITYFNNAEEALDKIYSRVYDLVFMDIELPGMKGNEAVKVLREHHDRAKAQLPVIAITGNVGKEDLEMYLSDGMSGFITKPIDPDKLRNIVNEVARDSFEREIMAPGAEWQSFPEPAAPSAAPVAVETGTNAAAVDTDVFNPDMLQSLKDTIGVEPLVDLLGDLITKTDELLTSMNEAVASGDYKTVAARAHELKGMAGNFGLVEMSSIAAQTENKAKAEELEGLAPLIESLPEANIRAQDALKNWVAA